MAPRTRKPTGAVPWPLILLEGGEKVGKSFAAAELSGSAKVGQTYWLDLNEGAADEYGAVPGARYLVIEHDGTWQSILSQVVEVRDEAARAAQAGEPPVVLVIDSMTAEWDLLKDWAGNRAKTSRSNQQRLQRDPNAEVQVSMNLWNDATARHRRLMTLLMTFPGIVVMTARGKEVASLDQSGRPIEGSKDYKVEGHKNLAYDASVWVRMSREHPPIVVGARSVHAGIRPGVDKPQPMPDFSLERLVFDALKCDPSASRVREMTEVKAGSESPDLDSLSEAAQRLLTEAEDASNLDGLQSVWTAINPLGIAGEITAPEADLVRTRVQALKAQMTSESNGVAA
ncbi:AAA family ATPase [Nonomuraea purpurea]|uniref:AAA family ATPase n=1 Tax=Nonomuraea purpurea TaxID=1849276 RepID=A0ABV8G0L8_9ACTN